MPIFDQLDIDLLAMMLGDDLQDAGTAYEPVEIAGTGSSVVRKYQPVADLPQLSISPAGANPRNIVEGGVQVPLAVWILSLPRGTDLQSNWLINTTVYIGECRRDTWFDVIGPEHPRSSETLSRWLVSIRADAPVLV